MQKTFTSQVFGDNQAPAEEVLATDYKDLVEAVDLLEQEFEALPTKINSDDDLGKVGKFVVNARKLGKTVETTRTEVGAPLLEATRAVNGFFGAENDRLKKLIKMLTERADDYNSRKEAENRRKAELEAEKTRKAAEEAAAKAEEAATYGQAAKAAGQAAVLERKAEKAEKTATGTASDLVRTKTGGVTASTRGAWTFRIDDYTALQASLGPLGPFLARADVEKAIRSVVRIQKDGTNLPGVTAYQEAKSTFRG